MGLGVILVASEISVDVTSPAVVVLEDVPTEDMLDVAPIDELAPTTGDDVTAVVAESSGPPPGGLVEEDCTVQTTLQLSLEAHAPLPCPGGILAVSLGRSNGVDSRGAPPSAVPCSMTYIHILCTDVSECQFSVPI